MREIVTLTNDLDEAKSRRDGLLRHQKAASWFKGTEVITTYSYYPGKDGGDASSRGHLRLYLDHADFARLLMTRLADAEMEVANLTLKLAEAQLKYQRIADPV